MRVLIAVFLIAGAMASPSPRTQQQAPANTKAQTAEKPNVTVVNNQESPTKEQHSTKAEAHRWPPPWWDPFWPTWAIVVVGTLAATAALKTLHLFKRQTEANEKSAQAALLNATAAVNSERAWITIAITRPDRDSFTFSAVNRGRTPAKITYYGGHFIFPTDAAKIGELIRYGGEILGGEFVDPIILTSAEPFTIDSWMVGSEEFPPDVVQEAEAGKKLIVYYGIVKYLDIVDKEHETRFCYRYGFRINDMILCGPKGSNSHT
jgi:hypothetical protein